MKNTFGNSISITIFGESHGNGVGAVIDGITPGITVDEEVISLLLSKRRPDGILSTARKEEDKYQIQSGVFNGKTTGTPICIFIPNSDTKSSDYNYGVARPSHADYAAFCKYHGNEDYRGGGHFSGRITAALVAAGGIFIPALKNLGIEIGTHILQCGQAKDRPFENIREDIESLQNSDFPVLNIAAKDEITKEILGAKESLDSVGGISQTAIVGLEAGLGEPWFDSVESQLAHALFSIGGIKGVEFGLGFGFSTKRGSQSNDPFRMEKGKTITSTNNNGGINGGITNGMPVIFQCGIKPTPSIAKPQDTVNFIDNKDATLEIKGRHDPAIIRRICPVIDSVTAIVVADMLAARYGTDVFTKGVC